MCVFTIICLVICVLAFMFTAWTYLNQRKYFKKYEEYLKLKEEYENKDKDFGDDFWET